MTEQDTKPKRAPIPDGVYLDLPFEDYLADDAIGGSSCLKLLTDPGAIQWESEANPLYEPPAKKPATRGQATHAAVLEGIDVYEQRFCVPPEGVLRTGDDMSAWLKSVGIKSSGKVDELRERILEARENLAPEIARPVFADEAVAGRQVISKRDDTYVRVVANFLRSDPAAMTYLIGGLPEVSIFATIDGVRFKGRIDILAPGTLLNLKTYMRPPGRGYALRTHLVRLAYYNGSDLQAVVQSRVAWYAAREKLPVFSATAATMTTARALLAEMATREKPPVYRWLYARTDGAPTCMVIPFRQSESRWQIAEREVDDAVEQLRRYREKCGDGVWGTSFGEQEIVTEQDWPYGAFADSDIEAGEE